MIENKTTTKEEILMDLELYSRKLNFLQNVKSYKDLVGIKLKGLDEDFNLTQDDLPFNMQEDISCLIADSIDYYEHQIEWLNKILLNLNSIEHVNY